MNPESKRPYVKPEVRSIPFDEGMHLISGVDLIADIEKAEPGEEIDATRKDRSRLKLSDALGRDRALSGLIRLVEQSIEKGISERGLVKEWDLTERQREIVEGIESAYKAHLESLGIKMPPSYVGKIKRVNSFQQFGIGGLDSVLSESVYLSGYVDTDPNVFAMVFAHEIAHRLGALSLRKRNTKGFGVERVGVIKPVEVEWRTLFGKRKMFFPGYMMVNEGVAECCAMYMLKKAGIHVDVSEFSDPYTEYRELVASLAVGIGGDFEKGMEIILKAHFTGDDAELARIIEEKYAAKGGYNRFCDYLNQIHGYAGPVNKTIHDQKKLIRLYTQIVGIDPFPLSEDKNYVSLMDWLKIPSN